MDLLAGFAREASVGMATVLFHSKGSNSRKGHSASESALQSRSTGRLLKLK